MRSASLLLALAISSLPTVAWAQVAQHRALTLEGARNVIAAGTALARSRAGTGVIAVVDAGGNLMALERLDGTFAAGANVSIGKARTAALFQKPTRVFEEIIRNGRTPMLALEGFTPLTGGVPILVDSEVVGAVGVSGAASAQEDEEIALAGAAAVTSRVAQTGPARVMGVSYVPRDDVRAAFQKGAVLLNGEGRNYMVHASRRDRAGQAEIHGLDTDIIYVLDGSATFVTGGSVVAARTVEPGEIRGDAIEGGDSRRIGRGDVITVSNGTPHWFQQVDAPLTYYVVKVR